MRKMNETVHKSSESAEFHISFEGISVGAHGYILHTVSCDIHRETQRMCTFVLIIWLALIIPWMWLFIIIATIHHFYYPQLFQFVIPHRRFLSITSWKEQRWCDFLLETISSAPPNRSLHGVWLFNAFNASHSLNAEHCIAYHK